MQVSDYTSLITTQYANKPKFVAWLSAIVDPIAKLGQTLQKFPAQFDLDVAIGVQLDVIGLWVGVSRNLPSELDFYFEWNGTVANGWDNGLWKGIGDPDSGIVVLGDNVYRRVIKAKIQANSWTGNRQGLYSIMQEVFEVDDAAQIIDNQDMTFKISIDSTKATELETAILSAMILPIKPVGVGLTIEVV